MWQHLYHKIKNSRTAGFLLIGLAYVLSVAVGVLVYSVFTGSVLIRLLAADIAGTIVIFLFSSLFHNASVYDPYWSVQPPVIVLAFYHAASPSPMRTLMLLVVFFWGIRLTYNWAYTFRDLNHQDWRYTMISEKTGMLYPLVNFTGIHLVPTLIVYMCVLPAVCGMLYEYPANTVSFLFLCLSFCAAVIQGLADLQMHAFRRSGVGGFIRTGLWKNARHPNYLCEILMWWGVALSVVYVMPQHWYLCLGAAVNTAMFRFISIPMADRRQAKKEGYYEYEAQTHMLLPTKKRR